MYDDIGIYSIIYTPKNVHYRDVNPAQLVGNKHKHIT